MLHESTCWSSKAECTVDSDSTPTVHAQDGFCRLPERSPTRAYVLVVLMFLLP